LSARAGPGEYPVFDTEIVVIGVPIDMDLCALEVPRIMGLKGAKILFTPM
jgi:predicted amidohydrolase